MSITVTQLVGKRCLLHTSAGHYGSKEYGEFHVLEASPSGNWIKLQNIYGRKFWKPVAEVSLIEELTELRPERPPDV